MASPFRTDEDSKRKQNAKKLQTVAAVMGRKGLSASDRVIFWRLSESRDPLSLRCWLSQSTIADRLHLDIKTVKRSISKLEKLGIIQILKIDHRNEYVLAQVNERGELELSRQQNTPRERAFSDRRRGRKRPKEDCRGGGENGLRLPSDYPLSNSLSGQTQQRVSSCGAAWLPVKESSERPSEQRGDEAIERKLVEIINNMGANGMEVMGALHEIDGGAPRLRLLARLRNRELDAADIQSAILLAKKGRAGQKSTRF